MSTELLGVIATYGLTVLLAYPLGRHIAKVYKGERNWMDFMAPLERLIFQVSGVDPKREMHWKEFLKALLTISTYCGLSMAFSCCYFKEICRLIQMVTLIKRPTWRLTR